MLNKEQQEAVAFGKGQMCIIACPGSGKTTVLLNRLQNLTSKYHVDPNHIIMMTFTKAAAEEMGTRYAKLPDTKEGVTFCTIHALCLDILRKYGNTYEILTEEEKNAFFFKQLRYNNTIQDKEHFVKDLVLDISVHKNNPGRNSKIHCTTNKDYFRSLYQAYEDYKTECEKIDFDDMLLLAYELLLNNSEIVKELQEKYQFIQVDEYQDTNYLQKNIIYLLSGENGNLVIVGDDDQSIYGFRGAMPEIMLGFKKDFPNAKMLRMGTNYRSCATIIDTANALIQHNKERYDKEFKTFHQEPGKVRVKGFKTYDMELEIVCKEIKSLINSGAKPEDIGVIYRTNKQSEPMVSRLMRMDVPFHVQDGVTNKYEHWIFKDIISFYKMANNAGTRADLIATLNKPQRYLKGPGYLNLPDKTENGCYKISARNEKAMRLASYSEECEFWQLKKRANSVAEYFRFLKKLSRKHPLEFIDILMTEYGKYLKEYSKFRNIDVQELIDMVDVYKSDIEKCGNTWKEWIQYSRVYSLAIKKSRESKEGVTLTTMHRSKGLEWTHVYIIDCVEGKAPYFDDTNRLTKDGLEEERRLFYVAETRAKVNLNMYYYKNIGGKDMERSRFLTESNVRDE